MKRRGGGKLNSFISRLRRVKKRVAKNEIKEWENEWIYYSFPSNTCHSKVDSSPQSSSTQPWKGKISGSKNNSRNTGECKSTRGNSCWKSTPFSAQISKEISANSQTCSTRAMSTHKIKSNSKIKKRTLITTKQSQIKRNKCKGKKAQKGNKPWNTEEIEDTDSPNTPKKKGKNSHRKAGSLKSNISNKLTVPKHKPTTKKPK